NDRTYNLEVNIEGSDEAKGYYSSLFKDDISRYFFYYRITWPCKIAGFVNNTCYNERPSIDTSNNSKYIFSFRDIQGYYMGFDERDNREKLFPISFTNRFELVNQNLIDDI